MRDTEFEQLRDAVALVAAEQHGLRNKVEENTRVTRQNTRVTENLAADTKELVALLRSAKSLWTVVELCSKLIKPLAFMSIIAGMCYGGLVIVRNTITNFWR